ncbi:MAG TPA: hypothetical protein VFU47_01625 [Armatimonadota bacterium]|nr:hypothetical protein [Armatimonadota bacterium]
MPEKEREPQHSRGIPPPHRPGEPDTGDPFTATTEGGTAESPYSGVVTPPGEGGILTGPSRSLLEEEEEDVR